MIIQDTDKVKFKKKVQAYVDGRGRLTPKWLRCPTIDDDFIRAGSDVKFTPETCNAVYPFDKGVRPETKFRVLMALRFSSLLGGLAENSDEVKYITEWIKRLLMDSEFLRNKCGIRDWSPPWEIVR